MTYYGEFKMCAYLWLIVSGLYLLNILNLIDTRIPIIISLFAAVISIFTIAYVFTRKK